MCIEDLPEELSVEAFTPTPYMRRYARICLTPGVTPTEEARCEAANVSPRSLRRWRADPRFGPWFSAEVERLLRSEVWEIWASVHRMARAGNLQAAKLVLERFDPDAGRLGDIGPLDFRALADLAGAGRATADAAEPVGAPGPAGAAGPAEPEAPDTQAPDPAPAACSEAEQPPPVPEEAS